MLKTILTATLLLAAALPATHASEPDQVVAGIYDRYPWPDLPPGGAQAWYPHIAEGWLGRHAEAGKAFLAGGGGPVTGTATEIVERIEAEARVLVRLSGADGAARSLFFGVVLDDDDDTWRVIEVFTEDGRYLSEMLGVN